MRAVDQLSREELLVIARTAQELLYLDQDDAGDAIWNPDKLWAGATVCEELAAVLHDAGLVPSIAASRTAP